MSLNVTSIGWVAYDYDRWDRFIGQPKQRAATCPSEGWFDAAAHLGKRGYKYLSNASRYLLAAATQAVEKSEVPFEKIKDRAGIIIGTNQADYWVRREVDRTIRKHGADALNAIEAPNTAVNLPASHVAIRFGCTGPNITLTNQHLAGLETFYVADRLMRRHGLDAVLCGAVEDSGGDVTGGAAVLMIENSSRTAQTVLARIDAVRVDFLPGPEIGLNERIRADLERRCIDGSALWLLTPCAAMASRIRQSLPPDFSGVLRDLSSMNTAFYASHTLLPFLQLFWLMANGHEGHVLAVSPLGHVVMFTLHRGDIDKR